MRTVWILPKKPSIFSAEISGSPESLAHFEIKGSGPVSRVLSGTAIHLGAPSPTRSSDLPGSHAGPMIASLRGLAPDGVCPATPVAKSAVRSYRTFSPLPNRNPAVSFLWHFPWARAPQKLSGILSCGARTFLRPQAATVRPASMRIIPLIALRRLILQHHSAVVGPLARHPQAITRQGCNDPNAELGLKQRHQKIIQYFL